MSLNSTERSIPRSTAVYTISEVGQFKSSHEPVFSRETYTVKLERIDGLMELHDFPHKLRLRGDLLKVMIVADRQKYVTEWQGDNECVEKVAARRAAAI
jgi:hypothetical protein